MSKTSKFDCGFEIKSLSEEGDMTFSGYGAVFGNVDAYGDVIVKGAFSETLAEAKTANQWPLLLVQHGGWGLDALSLTPVGIWTELKEDDHGLYVEGKLAPTPRGQEIYALLKMTPRPAFNGLSIGYIPKKYTNRTKPEEPRRTLEAVKLMEISLVSFPANYQARVLDIKSGLEADIPELADMIRLNIDRLEAMTKEIKHA